MVAGGPLRRPSLRLVLDVDEDPMAADERAPADALEALLLAKRGYQAAVDAADGARVPSLTDFVD